MNNQVITIPNMVSLSRLILAWPIAYAIYHDKLILCSILGMIAILSDFLDGYLSRKLNQVSDAGKVIDPIVDSVLVLAIMVALYIKQLVPNWYIQLIIGRYSFIFLLLSAYRYWSKQTPKSILSGKLSMCSIAVVITFAIFQSFIPSLYQTALTISTIMLCLSMGDYVWTYRYIKT